MGKENPSCSECQLLPSASCDSVSAEWRVKDYEEKGCLSGEQLRELQERFGLTADQVAELSLCVGNALDIESEIGLAKVIKSKAISRANKKLEQAISQAKKLELVAAKVNELLASLDPDIAPSLEDAKLLVTAKERALKATQALDGFSGVIEAVQRVPGAAADLSAHSQNEVIDARRYYLVEQCCYIWAGAERAVSYTTRPDASGGKQRQGPLIDLIKAVAFWMTDPGHELSGETIRKDINRFKMLDAKRRNTLSPPK